MKWLVAVLGILLLVGSASALTYSYASQYPVAQNNSFVCATSSFDATYLPYFSTDPSKSLTGNWPNNAWLSSTINNSQRFSIDLGSAKLIKRIYVENGHDLGGATTYGVRNFTIWGSNVSGSFANRTYSNNTGWVQITAAATHFEEHIASDVADPQYILLTNTVPYRYYSLKFSDNYGYTVLLGIRRLELQTEISWVYSTPGTYYWVAPANVTSITASLGGGGGSGKGAWIYYGNYYRGLGGSAGEWSNHASIATTPGTNYTVIVGAGGAESAVGTIFVNDYASNPGGLSSAFTYTGGGGDGGLSSPSSTNSPGGAGAAGFLTGGNADPGGATSSYSGGTAGSGYSSGGGGGAAQVTPQAGGVGGKGSDGVVIISQTGYSTSNTPDFVGTPLSGVAGTLVHFVDNSLIIDNTNLTYLWDFGDGTTSGTSGNVLHVYSYTGSYTVKLTLTSDTGAISEEKEAYVNIVSEPSVQPILPVQPRPTKFTIVDGYGTALPGALVTAHYINSSLPSTSTSWLISSFGVNASVAGEMVNGSLAMQGTTGSDGSLSFIMYPVLEYQLTITNTTAGLSKTVNIYPQDTDYVIKCLLTSQIPPTSRVTQLANSTLYVTEPNSSFVMFNIIYQDTSGYTTGLIWNVTCLTNHTVMYSKNFGDPDTNVKVDNYTVTTAERGTEYRAMYDATRTLP